MLVGKLNFPRDLAVFFGTEDWECGVISVPPGLLWIWWPQKKLKRANAQFRAWCKRTGYRVALKRLTTVNLSLKKGSYPDLWF